MNAMDICTAIREMKPSADDAQAILIALANNLGFDDKLSVETIEAAADVVAGFIGHQDALDFEAKAEDAARGPI